MDSRDQFRDAFLDNIVPGNYWITKSMEFTKKETSGTLWYLKKFLVYYYYLFFTDKFQTDEGVAEIVSQIDNFIASLDPSVQANAVNFFYPPHADLKAGNYKSYSKFSSVTSAFATEDEHKAFILNTKKYYFMYLMGFGGQAGHKKAMKEGLIESETFEEFLEKTEAYFDSEQLSATDKRGMYSDFPAVIRNERQIYFYFGFFHGSETASLGGFYKFTPIGKAAIKANFHELLIIWEHQKLRMVSQPPSISINKLDSLVPLNEEQKRAVIDKVDNLNHPYYTLLRLLESAPIDQTAYKYIVARLKNSHSFEQALQLVGTYTQGDLVEHTDQKVAGFDRAGDASSEDFEKERKKYVLGIQQLRHDNGSNYLAFLDADGAAVVDTDKADLVISVYDAVIAYLDSNLSDIYQSFSQYLKQYYSKQIGGGYQGEAINEAETRFNWYNYITNFDPIVVALLIYSSLRLRKADNSMLTTDEISTSLQDYPVLLKEVLGITTKKRVNEVIGLINSQHADGVLDTKEIKALHALIDGGAEDNYIRYEAALESATLERLAEYSSDNAKKSVRERDPRIINAMRGYYHANFRKEDGLIECDSCGATTFISQNGTAYLEFHHLIPFSIARGPDHYLNLAGICPLCHRKFHHLKRTEKPALYADFEQKNHLKQDLNQRLDGLYTDNVLEPLHLDYLVAEGAITNETMDNMLKRDIQLDKT